MAQRRRTVPGTGPKTPSRAPAGTAPTARTPVNQFTARLPAYVDDFNRYVNAGLAPAIPSGLTPQQQLDWMIHEAYRKGGLYQQARAAGYQPGSGMPADFLLKSGGGAAFSYPSEFVAWAGKDFQGATAQIQEDYWNRWLGTFAGKTWSNKHPGEGPPTGGVPVPPGGGGSGGGTGGGTGTGGDGTGGGGAGGGGGSADTKHANDLFAEYQRTLEEFGLTGLDDFLKKAVKEDWNASRFIIELRRQPGYLSNPLFAANLENAKKGGRFLSEGEVINFGAEAKRLAKQFGYKEPSNNYLALAIGSNLSLGELEHRYAVQRNVNEMGTGVRWVFENELGVNITDQDLFEIFDPEKDTGEFDQAYKNALYRGRPVALGLGVRSQAEADAFRALGVDPEEAFKRYEGLAANSDRFEKLGAIEGLINDKLPSDYGSFLSSVENSTINRALLFNDPQALQELQNAAMREVARNNAGGGVVGSQGVLTGLIAPGAS